MSSISHTDTGLGNKCYPPSPDIHVQSASNEIKGKSEVLEHKYSSCELLTYTVTQDCECDFMCMCMHKRRPAGIREAVLCQ